MCTTITLLITLLNVLLWDVYIIQMLDLQLYFTLEVCLQCWKILTQ